MNSLAIIGAGGHGAVVADAASCSGAWSEIAFFDDRWPSLQAAAGHPVAGDVAALRSRAIAGWPADLQVVVAMGDNELRLRLSREFQTLGARLATIVHPAAVVARSSTLGAGTVVFAGAVINPRCELGLACIINTGAIVDHDARLDAATHVCPAAALAGNVSTGEAVTIGVGSCVIPGRQIGALSTVGAGSTVIHDVDPGCTVVGNPARKI